VFVRGTLIGGAAETEARCGRLARPLDPARPDGPSIELHVAVLPALARHPRPGRAGRRRRRRG
jgi:hypothetical protein